MITDHCESFAGASLSIGHDARIVTVETACYQVLNFFLHGILTVTGVENTVKPELLGLVCLLIHNSQLVLVHDFESLIDYRATDFSLLSHFTLEKGSDAAENSDVATHIL